MKSIMVPVAALLMIGCVTVQDYPNKRPLSTANMEAIGKTNVVVADNLGGVGKSWFMTDSSAAGAQYGLLGALVTGVMDAIMNAGPARRAQKSADELAELVPADTLVASLVHQLEMQKPSADAKTGSVSIAAVSTAQRVLKPKPGLGALDVLTTYTLSEDASAFRVIANVSYEDPKLKYASPYTSKKALPKSELAGPVYRNVFTYQSAQLPVPANTTELRGRLAASIRDSYKDANGAPPAADSADAKAMAKELEKADDPELTKDEIAIFLTRSWLEDGGALLKREIENSHVFIARYVVQDLNSAAVPSFTGQDELIETMTDGRTVRRVGAGLDAGTYVSAPGDLKAFATYGNAVAIAKVQSDKIAKITRIDAAKRMKKKKTT